MHDCVRFGVGERRGEQLTKRLHAHATRRPRVRNSNLPYLVLGLLVILLLLPLRDRFAVENEHLKERVEQQDAIGQDRFR
jgi:hypothetical protein